jgi:Flp pilus assembly protein TadG
MVTAETAVVLPALLLVLALAVSAVGHVLDVVRATDAARAGARAAARGDPDPTVQLEAVRELPSAASSDVVVHREGDRVRVTVSLPGAPLLPFTSSLRWPRVTVTAVAADEHATP